MSILVSITLIMVAFIVTIATVSSREESISLTFKLSDTRIHCFYHQTNHTEEHTFDFQANGASNRVDVLVRDQNQTELYNGRDKKKDMVQRIPVYGEVYSFCFSHPLASLQPKKILFRVSTLANKSEVVAPVATSVAGTDSLDNSLKNVRFHLLLVKQNQETFRFRENQGYHLAKTLNHRIILWSIIDSVAMITLGIIQIILVRGFFEPSNPYSL